MQDNSANVLEALPPVAAPPPMAAPSPPTTTPSVDEAAVIAPTTGAPVAAQQGIGSAQAAPSPAAPTLSMPPPNTQTGATTPTGTGVNATQPNLQQDPICAYLLQDAAFVAAVRKQDAGQAASAAAKVIKQNLHAIMARIKPQQNAAMASLLAAGAPHHQAAAAAGAGVVGVGGYPGAAHLVPMSVPGPPGSVVGMGERRLSDPDGRFRRGSSCEPPPGGDLGGMPGRVRELRRGDWVVIRSANKSTDPELLGQDAWVARVEHNGWVELQVPKLGRTVKLQQRYLQLIPTQHPPMMLGPPPGPMPPGHAQPLPAMGGLPPPAVRRMPSDAGGGMGPQGGVSYLDEQGRPYKRQQVDAAVRPALLLELLPPARVASTPGRGNAPRVKDVLRGIRRELLAVEESIPWNCVAATWKNVRPGWRRSLHRSIDPSPQPPAGAVVGASSGGEAAASTDGGGGAAAASSAALAALMGSTAASMLELHESLMTEKGFGLFARRGAWETRLRELADGGNNHACLQALWAEMAEGIKAWMAAGGLPPGTPGGAQGAGAMPSYRSYDGGLDPLGNQTPREPYGAPIPDDYHLAAQQQPYNPQGHSGMQLLPSPFGDYAAGGAGAGAGVPGSARGAGAPFPPVPGSARGGVVGGGGPSLSSWMVRSDLALLMQSLESEVDTDQDEGPEVTDLEDSDGEPPSPVRRQQQLRRQQQVQPAKPAEAEAVEVGCGDGGAAVHVRGEGAPEAAGGGAAGGSDGDEAEEAMEVDARAVARGHDPMVETGLAAGGHESSELVIGATTVNGGGEGPRVLGPASGLAAASDAGAAPLAGAAAAAADVPAGDTPMADV